MRDWSCLPAAQRVVPSGFCEADDDLDQLAAGGGRLRARRSGREHDEAE